MLVQEARHAWRRLWRRPGASGLVALTMALGIGVTTVLFSLIQGVLLSPLPWPESDRLVRLAETRQGATRQWPWTLTNATYLAWKDAASTLDGLAAWQRDEVTLSAQGEAQRVRIAAVTASLFPLLRSSPAHGVVFSPAQESTGAVVVLSHGLWQQRFGGSLEALGQTVQLDGEAFRILGVMPPEFAFPDREARAWVPLDVPEVVGEDGESLSISIFGAMARLAPGVDPQQAAAEGTARGRGAPDLGMVAQAMFGGDGPPTVTATLAREALTAEVRPALLLLLVAVGLLLATAIANVAGLQLARATARSRELALRAALGAGTVGLQRLLLIECTLLGVLGGAGGLVFAWLAHRSLPALLPADFPRLDAVALDGRVTLFALGLSLTAGIGFGLLPVSFARRLSLSAAIAHSGAGSVSGTGSGARRVLLVGQVAIASVLLLGGLQLGRSFFGMMRADRGYESTNLLTARLPMPDGSYTAERRAQIVEGVSDRLRAVPGVTDVGFSGVVPLGNGDSMMTFSMPAPGSDGGEVTVSTGIRVVSPGYFGALGRVLSAGRSLRESDSFASAPVVLVNRTFAQRYLNDDASVLGAQLPARLDGERMNWEVVGLVENVVQQDLAEPPQPELFVSHAQLGQGIRYPAPTLLVRTRDRPEAIAPILRAAVREQDSALVPDSVQTMEQRLLGSLAQPRLYSVLFGAFATCALLIAAVGLFGLLSQAVTVRTREIGVRVALGARRAEIVGLICGQGLRLVTVGVAAGLVVSMLLARFTAGFLYGVRPHDPLGTALAILLIAGIALLASLVPVRRATAISPQEALRSE